MSGDSLNLEDDSRESSITSTNILPNLDYLGEDKISWWPDLPEVDRLNILASPLEDRARLLAAKDSDSIDSTIRKIADRCQLPFLENFELVENPTKKLPLRLIHAFSCLPIKKVEFKQSKKNKVLFVDDDESILRGFRLNLAKDFEVITANNGIDGFETFKNHGDIEVVISDMVMPQMNGPEMLEQIKQYDSRVMTVLLTGHSNFELTQKLLIQGKFIKFFPNLLQ